MNELFKKGQEGRWKGREGEWGEPESNVGKGKRRSSERGNILNYKLPSHSINVQIISVDVFRCSGDLLCDQFS